MNKIIAVALWAASAALLLLLLMLLPLFPAEHLSRGLAAEPAWRLLVHTGSNALYTWRSDPLLAQFSYGSGRHGSFQIAVFWLGAGLLFYRLPGLRLQSGAPGAAAAGAAALLCSLLVLLFGRDAVLLGALAWLPIAVCAFHFVLAEGITYPIRAAAAVGIGTLLMSGGANQLAVLLGPFALYCGWRIAGRPSVNRVVWALLLIISVFPGAAALFSAPLPELPEYPPYSHVVEDDGLSGDVGSLVGPSPSLSIIDRRFIKERFGFAASAVLAACLLLFIGRSRKRGYSPLLLPAVLLSGVLLCDTLLPESLSLISPLAVLPRIIPGLFYFPLAPLAAAASLVLVLGAAVSMRRSWVAAVLAGVLLAQPVLAGSEDGGGRIAAAYPSLQRRSGFASAAREHMHVRAQLASHLVSPSFHLISSEGLHVLSGRERLQEPEFQRPTSEGVKITTFRGAGDTEAGLMIDGREDTRWSSRSGGQSGDEWLHLRFAQPEALAGLQLATGAWHSDFPRGLELRYLEECEPGTGRSAESYHVLRDKRPWLGRIRYTEQGFPYYSSQADVMLFFPQKALVQCLLIRQTAKHPVFDWSVAEIRFLTSSPDRRK